MHSKPITKVFEFVNRIRRRRRRPLLNCQDPSAISRESLERDLAQANYRLTLPPAIG